MKIQRCRAFLVISACAVLWSQPQAEAQDQRLIHHVRIYIPEDNALDGVTLARMLTQEMPTAQWEVSTISSSMSFKAQLLQAQEAANAEALTLVAWLSADGQSLHLYMPHQEDARQRLSSRALTPTTPALRGTAARQITFILQQLLPSIPKTKTHDAKPANPQRDQQPAPKALTPLTTSRPLKPAPLSVHISGGVGLLVYSSAPSIRYIFHARATLFTLTYLGIGLYADWMPQVREEGLDHTATLGHQAIALDLAHRWLMSSGELVLSLGIGAEHTQGQIVGVEDRAISRWAVMAVPSLKWRHRLTDHVHAQVGVLARLTPKAQRYYYGPDPSQLVPRWRIAPSLTLGINAHWP